MMQKSSNFEKRDYRRKSPVSPCGFRDHTIDYLKFGDAVFAFGFKGPKFFIYNVGPRILGCIFCYRRIER